MSRDFTRSEGVFAAKAKPCSFAHELVPELCRRAYVDHMLGMHVAARRAAGSWDTAGVTMIRSAARGGKEMNRWSA
jgi:hypothetical protein